MSFEQPSNVSWLVQLKEHLKQEGYSPESARRRLAVAERFLAHLNRRHSAVEAVDPSSVSLYLQDELQLFEQNRHRTPRSSMADWRRSHTPESTCCCDWSMGSGHRLLFRRIRERPFIATCANSMTSGCAIYADWRSTPDPAGLPMPSFSNPSTPARPAHLRE